MIVTPSRSTNESLLIECRPFPASVGIIQPFADISKLKKPLSLRTLIVRALHNDAVQYIFDECL